MHKLGNWCQRLEKICIKVSWSWLKYGEVRAWKFRGVYFDKELIELKWGYDKGRCGIESLAGCEVKLQLGVMVSQGCRKIFPGNVIRENFVWCFFSYF